MWARLRYSINLQIQTYTETVPLKYGKLTTKYLWIYGYFFTVQLITDISSN